MKRTPQNILQHELIGLKAKVAWSRNPCQIGLEGIIIDETMNTITLRTVRGPKMVLKEHVRLLLELPGGVKILVEGAELKGRPEDRLKKRVRRW